MQDEQTPTLEDLARLFETAAGGGHHPGAAATARWLIEQTETACELQAELLAKPGEEPSLMELARVLCAIASEKALPEAVDTAHWLVAQSEPARAQLDRLEQLKADAGETRWSWGWTQLLDCEQQLGRLLEAADDWQDPREVLDPTRERGLDCSTLHRLCRARIERSSGAVRRRLEMVRDKLERSAELERLLPNFPRRFERLRSWLEDVGDLEDAGASLEDMARLLRSTLESSTPE